MQPGDTAHAPQAAAHTAGRKGIYLFSPNSPGTSKPWPFVPEAQAARSGAGRAGQGSETRLRVLCWDGDIALRRLCGQRAGSQVHARPRAPASGVSPGPGRCLKGCLPGQGGFAGAGCSFSSDCGCSSDSPACPGGKQAGRPSSWLKTRKPSQIREKEAVLCPPRWRLKSVHAPRCPPAGRAIKAARVLRGIQIPTRSSGRAGRWGEGGSPALPGRRRALGAERLNPTSFSGAHGQAQIKGGKRTGEEREA